MAMKMKNNDEPRYEPAEPGRKLPACLLGLPNDLKDGDAIFPEISGSLRSAQNNTEHHTHLVNCRQNPKSSIRRIRPSEFGARHQTAWRYFPDDSTLHRFGMSQIKIMIKIFGPGRGNINGEVFHYCYCLVCSMIIFY
jgi:hypothetical protein